MRALGRVLAASVGAVVVVAGAGIAYQQGLGPFPDPEGCVAEVGDVRVDLELEQAENAALITSIALQRGMPARAASIALATAYQESKIRNIDHGDRDSLGLFQQRPSQGWGTAEQVMDPVFSTNAFYDALEKVDGYEDMRITEAAQEVQRSAFPEAYADHEEDGRAIASAMAGYSRAAFWCSTSGDAQPGPDRLDSDGLVPRAAAVKADLEAALGDLPLGGFQAGGVSTGHMEGSAHYEGRAIDIFVRPVSEDNKRRGWAIASYLVANADRLDIATVIFDDRIWHAGRRSQGGWTDYDVPSSSGGDQAVLEHRDHVHVDVID